jgi:hypothetical protein
MDLTEGSETSVKLNQTPGKYPKENIQVSEHGEKSEIKSKATPLQALTSPEGSRRLRLPDFKTIGT